MLWIALDLAKLQSWSAHQLFLLKNCDHTKNERKGKDKSNKRFFKDHLEALLELKTNDALI